MNPERAPGRGKAKRETLWQRLKSSGLLHLAGVLVVLSLFNHFIAQPFRVPSGSMEQTLQKGDRIYAEKVSLDSSGPDRGDIVVFTNPDSWGGSPHHGALRTVIGTAGDILGFGASNHVTVVKRVIGLPGDTVECCNSAGQLLVNGSPQHEPSVYEDETFDAGRLDCSTTPRSLRCFEPVTVGRDEYLVMGDHRSDSADSVIACRGLLPGATDSCARLVPRADLVGKVVLRVWPPSRIGVP